MSRTTMKTPERRVYDLLTRYGTMSHMDVAEKLNLDPDIARTLLLRLEASERVGRPYPEARAWHPAVPF